VNPNYKRDLARIDQIIGEIKQSQERPGWKPLTSAQMRIRTDRMRDMAVAIKLTGGRLKPEYE
jgi:hypothetical protein